MSRPAFPLELDLQLISKRPARLRPETEQAVLASPLPPPHAWSRGLPRASIAVLTQDNLVFTRMCIESVLASTDGPSFELIVVDNDSEDGTQDYLRQLASRDARVRPLLMETNLGFACGVNAALRKARGDTLVMLNNDTVVAPGWLGQLQRHLDDRTVGLVGPVTNQAPGVARVSDPYRTYGEFLEAAASRLTAGPGRDVATVTLFCAALPRRVYSDIGPLDERFEVGMFEDDDYCLRVAAAGLKVRLADDVLVHHFGEASFGRLVSDGTWKAVFEANRRRFEQKWERQWTGHQAPDEPEYVDLVARVRTMVETLPREARILVATRGDDRLCDIPGRTAGHFPQMADGAYAGSYPADDIGAVAQLNQLRDKGWTHLAFPNSARWWLDHYPSMTRRLEQAGVVVDDPAAGVVFRLS